MNYKIPLLNGEVIINNPTIIIVGLDIGNPELLANPDFINKIIGLKVKLITPKTDFVLDLENIKVESMSFTDGALLQVQVVTALNEQFSV